MRNLITASVALASLAALAVPALANDEAAPQSNFMDEYAIALGLADACPSWRIDQARLALARPDDAYRVVGAAGDRLTRKARSLASDMACDLAEMKFGPDGVGVPGLMKKR